MLSISCQAINIEKYYFIFEEKSSMKEVQETSCVWKKPKWKRSRNSSKWTLSILCQAKRCFIFEEKSSVFSFFTSWLIVSSDILT